jgi:hypothetical protein
LMFAIPNIKKNTHTHTLNKIRVLESAFFSSFKDFWLGGMPCTLQ